MGVQAGSLPTPWLTCEAALTEAFHLLGGEGEAQLKRLLRRGALAISFSLGTELQSALVLMDKYSSVPMSLGDACLVRMAELNPRAEIITLDRHFRVYRTSDRRVLRLRTPGF